MKQPEMFMKNHCSGILGSILLALLLNACSSGSDCDKFLNGYEAFAQEYIDLVKAAKAQPYDQALVSKAMSMTARASEWADKASACSDDPKVLQRMAEIQSNMALAISGM
jgi:hypothetical protein